MQSFIYRAAVAAFVWCVSTAALAEVWSIERVPSVGSGSEQGNLVPPHSRAPLSNDARELVAGNNQFSIDLYRRLAADRNANQNMLASPFSISAALGMAYAGARGRTAEQMADVLRFTLPDDRLHAAFGEVIGDLDATRDGYQLSIANRMFGQQGLDFRQPFLDLMAQHYDAPLEPTNFVRDPEGSRERINDWVEEQTNDKIQDLLPQGSITDDTRLVLTNAIYFNGKWKYKFDETATHNAAFYAADGSATPAATMFQQQQFRYGDFDGFKMLEMPYAGDDLSMVVMLPDTHDGLDKLEASLTSVQLDENLAAMSETDVLVFLPKFKFDVSFKLGEMLQDMGMTDAFQHGGLTGIADGDFVISDVLHKAFIDVNEAGTEAAAATAVAIIGDNACFNCASPSPPVFRADHPFLFALRDTHSGSLLFMGRMAEPGESEITSLAGPTVPEPPSMVLMLVGLAFAFRRTPTMHQDDNRSPSQFSRGGRRDRGEK
jgi:serpin B